MTYLSEFTDYLKTRTDAPSAFHMHAGLCSIAVVMGTHCWLHGPMRNVYPNLNCIVLAPSGMGKSVPLDMASMMVRKAGFGARLLPSSWSQEALLDCLSREPVGFLVVQEFAAFQALLGRDYNRGAEQMLTELYDVPDTYERKTLGISSRSFTLNEPCPTILGASSPDWFAQAFKGQSLRGGWLSRFLFCPSRDAGTPIGDAGPRDEALEAGLADHLRMASLLSGPFDSSKTRGTFNEFAEHCRLSARESADFGGMRSRGQLMAQKVAMLFHVSRDPTTRDLSVADMQSAITFVERTLAAAEDYLTNEVAHDRKEEDRLRVMTIVRTATGRAAWSTALKNSHLDSQDFKNAVRTLVEQGDLVVESEGRGRVLSLPAFANSQANIRESANVRNGRAVHLAPVI